MVLVPSQVVSWADAVFSVELSVMTTKRRCYVKYERTYQAQNIVVLSYLEKKDHGVCCLSSSGLERKIMCLYVCCVLYVSL